MKLHLKKRQDKQLRKDLENNPEMKKCPYCSEEIRDEAVKCRYCGEWLEKREEIISNNEPPQNDSSIEKITKLPSLKNDQIADSIKGSEIIFEGLPVIPESIENKKKSRITTTLYYLYLIIFGLSFLGNSVAYLFSPSKPKVMMLFGFSFWCGVTAAVVARRNDKSGWLWFFIGFIPIGLSVAFVLSFIRALFQHQ